MIIPINLQNDYVQAHPNVHLELQYGLLVLLFPVVYLGWHRIAHSDSYFSSHRNFV